MKNVFLAALFLIAGCASVRDAEIDSAKCYLFPDFKTTTQPEFALTSAERARALRDWRQETKTAWTDGILYEVVVDGRGDVVKVRTVQPYAKDDAEQYFTESFKRALREKKFRADDVPDVYRTFCYAVLLKSRKHILNEP